MTEFPALSIIIINWKSANFTRKCLASIHARAKGINLEILVVDNASFDGCAEMIQKEFPDVRFIQSQDNLGFARANNLAFEYSKGEILLFLNPDTEIVGSALQDMMACLDSNQNAGAIGAKLLNSDLSVQTSCLQAFPSILSQVLDSEYLRTMIPKSSLWGTQALFEDSRQPVPVEGISGACLMVRRSLFEQIGYFNRDYFMYVEDMDLCHKIQKAGWTNYYVGDATVIHHGGQSSGSQSNNQFSTLVMKESLLKYFKIHRGHLYSQLFRLMTALAALGRISVLVVARLLPISVPRRKSLAAALVKWSTVFRWAIGLETWAHGSK
jgi:N-acetylglucosaminyl-diphospho-decaprenol L-rhamnosyltransferase